MKIGYLLPLPLTTLRSIAPGIAEKVLAQVKTFRNIGWECDLVSLPCRSTNVGKLTRRLPWCSDGISWESFCEISQYDLLYIRKPDYLSKEFIRFLQSCKLNGVKNILLEIPTYPYDSELSNFKSMPLLLKDKFWRKGLCGKVDRIVDLSGQPEIFSIPTIQIINGIDIAKIAPRTCRKKTAQDIHLLCVAAFSKWHGVERLINGLSDYCRKGMDRTVHVHLLGNGPSYNELKDMASRSAANKYLHFYGMAGREEMDRVYDQCDVAVSSLGLHRIGISKASTLKSREYLAKGIPFIYSGDIDVLINDPVDFCLQIPADESPVSIETIIQFHDGLYAENSCEKVTKRIRAYAEAHVSMEAAMEKVITYIKELAE